MKKSMKWILPIILSAAAILFAIFFIKGQPERFLDSYLKAVQSGNYREAYQQLTLPESEFLNGYLFEKTIVSTLEAEKKAAHGYEVKELKTDIETPKNGGRIFSVSANSGVDDIICGVYEVMKLKEKGDTKSHWKIVPIDMLVRDAELEIWSEGNAYVDDIHLNAENCRISEYQNIDHYEIPYLFAGIHTLRQENVCFQELEETVNVHSDNEYLGSNHFSLSEADQEKIASGTESLLIKILKNIQDGNAPLENGALAAASIQSGLWRIEQILHPDEHVIEPEVFTGMSTETPEFEEISISEIGPYINVSVAFSLDYMDSKQRYKTEFGQIVEQTETFERTEKFKMDVVYVYVKEKDDWFYSKIRFSNIYEN